MNSEVQITGTNDDAHQANSGAMDRGSPGVYVQDNNSCGGLMFRSLPVSRGSVLLSSRLWLYVNSAGESTPREDWYAEAPVDLSAISDAPFSLTNRIPAGAMPVRWAAPALGEGWRASPDMSTLLSTAVQSPGWSANPNILFLALRKGEETNMNTQMVFRSWDYPGDADPRLRITWLPPAQPIP
jgi:hypothetical protein